jgi:hypothetical protein
MGRSEIPSFDAGEGDGVNLNVVSRSPFRTTPHAAPLVAARVVFEARTQGLSFQGSLSIEHAERFVQALTSAIAAARALPVDDYWRRIGIPGCGCAECNATEPATP